MAFAREEAAEGKTQPFRCVCCSNLVLIAIRIGFYLLIAVVIDIKRHNE